MRSETFVDSLLRLRVEASQVRIASTLYPSTPEGVLIISSQGITGSHIPLPLKAN